MPEYHHPNPHPRPHPSPSNDCCFTQVVIFNFRADRVLELTKAFEEENFEPFDRKRVPKVRHELRAPAQREQLLTVRAFGQVVLSSRSRVPRTLSAAMQNCFTVCATVSAASAAAASRRSSAACRRAHAGQRWVVVSDGF